MKIITSFIVTLLIASILFNSTKVALTYAYYNIDPIGFEAVFCVNKDKPKLECHGKCHLNKIAKSQKSNSQIPEHIIDFKELLLFSSPLQNYSIIDIEIPNLQCTVFYKNLYVFYSLNDCFHPPSV